MNIAKQIGMTEETGFQIGVRKTFSISCDIAWTLITSPAGVMAWLGTGTELTWQVGESYRTVEGVSGEIRVFNPNVNMRLTWKKDHWQKPSTLQIRTIPNGDKTTISFHQENLADGNVREEMKGQWEAALRCLSKLINELKS